MRRRRLTSRLLKAFCVLVGVWLIAPTVVVIPMSFAEQRSFRFPPSGWSTDWYSNLFTDPQWLDAIVTSLEIAVAVAVISTVLGTAAAFGVERGRFRGRRVFQAFIVMPTVVPIVVFALAVYVVFLKAHLTGSFWGFVLGHTVLGLPFVIITVGAGLRSFDRDLERAALSLGASPLRTFWHVTLPMILPSVLIGALFAFLASWDEVVVSLFLVDPFTRTLPVLMYTSMTRDVDPTVAVASTLLLVFTTSLLVFAAIMQSRRTRLSA